ncbi:MAG: sensor histidine kinase [Zoogloea sp.]|jgi:two-component system sensor histidine kinase UhpB|nr:sensor histidine kinase [Zoogloea sp.]
MDLRWRLFGYVLGFALALLLAAAAWVGLALREDVTEEMAASTRLVNTMLAVSAAPESRAGDLEALLAGGQLRHVALHVERSNLEQSLTPARSGWMDPLVDYLLDGRQIHERRIPLGDGTLVIRADARAEIHEILRDGARIMATLLVFSLAMAVVAWLAAHRALKPVRELEDGLARVGRDEVRVSLPAFRLKEFASIASAIERMSGELSETRQARQQLARQLLDLQENERRELARELHDELGQSLTAVNVSAAYIERHAGRASPDDLAESARDIRRESTRMLGQVRNLLSQLRPHGLEGLQMMDALNDLVSGWRGRAPQLGIEAAFPESLPALPPAAGLALYRTVQEALTNVLRHSVASQVRLTLREVGKAVELTIADNGVGKASEIIRRSRGGLLGMRERAEMAGGSCWFDEAPGGGLQVRLCLPLAHAGA